MAGERRVAAMLLVPGDVLVSIWHLPLLIISVERIGQQVALRCVLAAYTHIQRIGYDAYLDVSTLSA